ncbi:hypothetical protein TEA_019386 [Camellia sinensis var. sinensis]|uniref:Protein kinase domain-containing protein n=1 Tax=Camellia sinensis var. sinensis TaxID=542762 RepID=A0A4S4EF38_CAMSN|nr:hypothetical protein TEA_019386 [Camellia sinensis var. sinensis]
MIATEWKGATAAATIAEGDNDEGLTEWGVLTRYLLMVRGTNKRARREQLGLVLITEGTSKHSSFLFWHLQQLWRKLERVLKQFTVASFAAAQFMPGCLDYCGNISIPYPFGTSKECYVEEHFLVTCNDTHYDPPKLFLTTSHIEITNMYLSGQLRISSVFTAVGCDSYAVILGSQGQKHDTGCLSLCDNINDVINGSCCGIGCCQTSIPKGVRSFDISVRSYNNHTLVWNFNPCSYAFVAEETAYNFSSLDLANLQNRTMFPVVLDWSVGNQTCAEAKNNLTSFACKATSDCHDFDNGPGYRCNCSQGYEGNPYLPNGCIAIEYDIKNQTCLFSDINECIISSPCNMTCQNLPGTYNCSCPEGYEGDGRKNGSGCSLIPVPNHRLPVINIALGISISISGLLLGGSWLYWVFRQRKIFNLREKFFQQNDGFMLKQQLSKREGSVQSAKIFTSNDLKKASNNYDESRVLGKGGQGTVYKGILLDNTIECCKAPRVLLGDTNSLVYEFVTNGTLYERIHNIDHNKSSITWENRLRIATETAAALSYLHSAASTPIIHRDVKSTNILLDDNYVAKVSDFGASRLIPKDQTQLTTLVQGTLGYLDPEYFHTSQLTEKSDVYSFGVVLVELLTGKKALSFNRPELEKNLAMYFVSSMKEDRLFEIVDEQVMNVAKSDQLKEVAILAKRCLRVKGDERPAMKEVAMELEGLRMMEKDSWVNDNKDLEETHYLLGDLLSNAYGDGNNRSYSAAYDSMANHIISPTEGGR